VLFLVHSPGWETRHAAALILREIIRLHASSAGLANLIAVTDGQFKHICEKLGYVANENCETACAKAVIAYIQQTRNNRYLEDLAVRLLCIFALDRFNDFVGDQAVAPVRETCGQLFGFVVRSLGDQSALKSLIIGGLLQLDNQNNLPHSVDIHSATRVLSALKFSAMIGLKYFMAAQKDAASFFLGLPGLKEALLQR
jgi:TATA-binding protein-associated factor